MSFGHNKDNFVNLVRLLSAGIDPTAPHVLKIWRQASSKVAESNNVSVTSSASEFPDGQKIGTFTSKNGFFRNFLNLLELHLIESLQLRRNTIVAVSVCLQVKLKNTVLYTLERPPAFVHVCIHFSAFLPR